MGCSRHREASGGRFLFALVCAGAGLAVLFSQGPSVPEDRKSTV